MNDQETAISSPQECGGSPENAHGSAAPTTTTPASPPASPWSAAEAEAQAERTARVARKRELLSIFFVPQPGTLATKRPKATAIISRAETNAEQAALRALFAKAWDLALVAPPEGA